MKNPIINRIVLAGIASLAIFSLAILLGLGGKAEPSLDLDAVPAAVRASIKKATRGAEIGEIEKELEEGKIVYEVEVYHKGVEFELAFDEKGRLAGFELEGDSEAVEDRDEDREQGEAHEARRLSIGKIPAAARDGLASLAGSAKIAEVELEEEDGVRVYEGSWRVKGVEHEARVTASGDLVETEQVISTKAAPKAVRKTVAKAFPEAEHVAIEKKTVFLYEVEARVDGEEEEILVSPTGRRIEMDREGDEEDEEEN